MKKIGIILSAILSTGMCVSAQNVEWGNEAVMDTLSYASGVNVAFGMQKQFEYVPFDYEIIDKTVGNTALGISTLEMDSLTMTAEELPAIVNDYFGKKYPERIKAGQAALDSLKVWNRAMYLKSRAFETQHERAYVSKAFAMTLGMNIAKSDLPVQMYWVLQGMRDYREGKAIMNNDKAQYYIRRYYEIDRPMAIKNQSAAWLNEMAQQKGVKVLPSGLLYKIEQKGDKKTMPVSDNDTVTVHYKGSKQSGEVFDATRYAEMPEARKQQLKQYRPDTYDKDEPITFELNKVIAGWTEGLKLIGKGGKITLWIPYNLAYGERGAGGVIAPYEALRFDIELVDVKNSAK